MKLSRSCFLFALAALVGCTTTQPQAPEKMADASHTHEAKAAAPSLSPEEMHRKWVEAGTPSDAHKQLQPFVGTWHTKTTHWMSPDAPPERSEGTATAKWLYDGRFLQEDYKGKMMGRPFNGMSLVGYNNVTGKYFTTWVDSMSTGLMTSEGDYNAEAREFTYTGSYVCPVAGKKEAKFKNRIVSDTQHIFEMYDTDPNGKEFKALEIVYTKKK
jgi:hypothetical protein